jgi:hypothetical protein
MSCVALGTTVVVVKRFEGQPAFLPLVIVHLAIYLTLYGLFVGAVWHHNAPNRDAAWSIFPLLDLALSAGLVAAMMRVSIAAFRRHSRGPNASHS